MKHKNILVLFLFTLSIDLAAQSIQNLEHLNLQKTIFDIKSTTSDKAGIGFMTKLDDKFRLIMDYSLLKDLLIENSDLSSISIKNMENQAYSTISIRAVYPPANLALLELDEYGSGFIEIGSEEDTPYFLVSPVQGKLDILNLTDMGLMETINTPSSRFMYSFLDSASVQASRSHSPVLNGKGQLISIALYDNETLKMMGLNKNEVKMLYALEEVFGDWAYKILTFLASFLSYDEDKLYSDDKKEIGKIIDSGGSGNCMFNGKHCIYGTCQ